jgi:adenylate kinase family enzyme
VSVADRIHITGAAGSGTSTLGVALANRFGYRHLDTDDYFWEPTDPPYVRMREVDARCRLLGVALAAHPRWVLSGSLTGWADMFAARFDLVVFLYIPREIRLVRLGERERQRFGHMIDAGGSRHQAYLDFMAWAGRYDTGDEAIRSLKVHEAWMATLRCRWVRLDGDLTTDERIARLTGLVGIPC